MIWLFFKGFAITIGAIVSLGCLAVGATVIMAFLTSTLENLGMNRADAESTMQIVSALVVLGAIGGAIVVVGSTPAPPISVEIVK